MEKLVEMVKRHEGFMPHPYKDSVGVSAVGYGTNLEARGVTEFEAELMLRNELLDVEATLNQYTWFNSQNRARKDALVNMGYNLGVTGLLGFKNMITALSQNNYSKAKREALNSKWARQVGSRAKELAEIIETGSYAKK